MNRFFAPCHCNDNLDIKEWVLYVYLLSVAYYKDSDNGKILRGQALFWSRDLEPLMPRSTASRKIDSLVEKGLIIVDKLTKFPNSRRLITLCKYDEINVKSGQQWAALVGHKRATLDTVITDVSQENEKQWAVDNDLRGRSIDLTALTSFTIVKDIVDDTPPTPPKKKRTSKPKVQAPTAPLREAYKRHIMERYATEATFDARDNSMLAKILKHFKDDQDKAVKAIDTYFKADKKFWIDANHSLNILVSQIKSVETEMNKPTHTTITERRF